MTEPTEKPKSRTGLLIWMLVSQLLAVASLGFWLLAAAFSVMAFDSGDTPEARRFVLAVWSYPLFPLLTAIGAWVAFAFRKNRLAAVLTGLTFAPVPLFLLVMWIAA